MSFAITTSEVSDAKTKAISLAVTVLAAVLTCLTFLSFFSDVHTTINYGWGWVFGWVITLVVLLSLMTVSFIRKKAKITVDGGILKKVGYLLAGLFGFAALSGFAVLSGFPILMHYVSSDEGELQVTVIAKESNYRRRVCKPRLIIKEFTFFSTDHICPGNRVFSEIPVGATVRLKGKISPFGVEPEQIIFSHEDN